MQSTTDRIIEQWILEAEAATSDNRRRHRRHPFFRPITVTLGPAPGTKFTAFSRDISAGGIGLLHDMPLDTHQATVTLPTIAGDRVDLDTEIVWCEPCGEGWYLSGGRFTSLSARQMTNLFVTTIAEEFKRRRHQRHPFFRPVTVTIGGVAGTRLTAFSRDISAGGMGLLHNMPLPTHHVTLTIPTTACEPMDVRTKIMWCQPGGEGWFLSGARFSALTLEELPDMLL
jgi:hypothetical protein